MMIMTRDSRKSRKRGNHGNRDFRQMPWIPWFCQNAVFLPKVRSFTFLQEYFVFNQDKLKFIVW